MRCYQCNKELIWGGDHNGEDYGTEDYEIVSNLSCPDCDSLVVVYHQSTKDSTEKSPLIVPFE